jgi:signal transduction histidine kinase
MILPARNIAYEFVVDEKFKKLRVDMNVRRTLFLIFKESIYNSVKYAECDKIQIEMTHQGKNIHLRIEDNGKGFRMDQISSLGGNGLKNMKSRATEAGGICNIHTEINKGTIIEVEIPL